MSVSNERLEELIAQLRADFDIAGECCVPEAVAALGKISDLGNALVELKSIRQAATAGVEEAIRSILLDATHWRNDSHSDDDFCKLLSLRLTALLAERDAVLRECLEYVQDAVDEQSRGRELLTRIDALTKGGGDGK